RGARTTGPSDVRLVHPLTPIRHRRPDGLHRLLPGRHAAVAPVRLGAARPRWLHRTVELVHAAQSARAAEGAPGTVDAGRLTGDEENTLTVALADFRAVLATLIPNDPLDPAGAARPATVLTVVA